MSKDLRNTSLSAQAAQLKRKLESRDRQRQADKHARAMEREDDEGLTGVKRIVKSAAQQDAVATLEAISAQDEYAQPAYECDICKATFLSQVQYEQHLQSAVHRKTLERIQQEQAKIQRMQEQALTYGLNRNPQCNPLRKVNNPSPFVTWWYRSGLLDVTAMALGAAAWATTHDKGPATGGGMQGTRTAAMNGQHAGRQHRHHRHGDKQATTKPDNFMTHEQVTAALRAEDEPLHIDGWVPPSVAIPQPATQVINERMQGSNTNLNDRDGNSHDTRQAQDRQASVDDQLPSSSCEAGANVLGLGYDDDDGTDSSQSEVDSDASDSEDVRTEPKSFF